MSKSFSIYIHWPFCQSKCPYCDFNSHVRHHPIDEEKFLQAYKCELDYIYDATSYTSVKSIFFGGGTPSLMSAKIVHEVLDYISGKWSVDEGVEITLEANPSSVESSRFEGYKASGVNRISIGVQSFNDSDLKTLGRLHTAIEARQAIEIASRIYDRVSFDLIYARPEQSVQSWKLELEDALKFSVGHVSLYQLTIEPGTRFFDLYNSGKLDIPSDSLAEEHYLITQELCETKGLNAYEVSNHAIHGQECLHNLVYWLYEPYAGIGPGAHGRIELDGQLYATSTQLNPEVWSHTVINSGNGIVSKQPLTSREIADEMLLMGLRLQSGINLEKLNFLTGFSIDFCKIHNLFDQGYIVLDKEANNLMTSQQGRFVLNYIINQVSNSLIKSET